MRYPSPEAARKIAEFQKRFFEKRLAKLVREFKKRFTSEEKTRQGSDLDSA